LHSAPVIRDAHGIIRLRGHAWLTVGQFSTSSRSLHHPAEISKTNFELISDTAKPFDCGVLATNGDRRRLLAGKPLAIGLGLGVLY
jgi:hypothetical protein